MCLVQHGDDLGSQRRDPSCVHCIAARVCRAVLCGRRKNKSVGLVGFFSLVAEGPSAKGLDIVPIADLLSASHS